MADEPRTRRMPSEAVCEAVRAQTTIPIGKASKTNRANQNARQRGSGWSVVDHHGRRRQGHVGKGGTQNGGAPGDSAFPPRPPPARSQHVTYSVPTRTDGPTVNWSRHENRN